MLFSISRGKAFAWTTAPSGVPHHVTAGDRVDAPGRREAALGTVGPRQRSAQGQDFREGTFENCPGRSNLPVEASRFGRCAGMTIEPAPEWYIRYCARMVQQGWTHRCRSRRKPSPRTFTR
jgi:hypothetical protein